MSLKISIVVVLVSLVSLTLSYEVFYDSEVENATQVAKFQQSSGMDAMLKIVMGLLFKGINRLTMLGLALDSLKHENVSVDCQLALANLSTGINSGDMKAIECKFVFLIPFLYHWMKGIGSKVCQDFELDENINTDKYTKEVRENVWLYSKILLGQPLIFLILILQVKRSYPKIMRYYPFMFKIVDATAKIPAGIGMGSLVFLGSFDQCLAADYPSSTDSNFKGQYCAVKIKTLGGLNPSLTGSDDFKPVSSRKLDLRLDTCIPSTCSKRDLEVAIIESVKAKTSLFIDIEKLISVSIGVCQTRDVEEFTTGQIIAMVIFAVLGAILVIGTLLDVVLRMVWEFGDNEGDFDISKAGGSTISKILRCFSVYTNGMKLLNTEQGKGSLTAVNGVRFLSMSWVILGHAYYFINQALLGNLVTTANFATNFAFQAILNATVSVDSFFFLSGLLVTYVAIKGLRKDGKINWGLFYFHRFWRLTPAYAAVILFTLIFPLLGSGPTWRDENTAIVTNCQKSWWGSLLYINNLYKPEIMCLGHGWYLSNDMQFYILSPIILMALYKKPYLGFIVNFAFLIASIITPALLGMKFDFPPTTLFLDQTSSQNLLNKFFMDIYITPYCRMGPYCIGIYAGYFLAGNKKLNLSRITKTALWCLAIACNVSVLYGVFEWNQGNRSSTAIHAFYMSTHRTAWAIGLSWVVVACATGNGGIVNSILSWKLFVPLGRITYLAYLVHPMIQLAYSGLVRERIMYTDYTHITMFLGFLMISYGIAFGASLAVEAPFLGLEKIMFPNVKKETPKTNGVNGVDNKAFHETELTAPNSNDDAKL